MKKQERVRIRMLGNMWDYLVDEEYPVDIETANQLTGMGMAVLIEKEEEVEKGESDGL